MSGDREYVEAREKQLKAEAEKADAATLKKMSIGDFVAFLPMHKYIFTPTGDMWPSASIDAMLPKMGVLRASLWLDQHQSVVQTTWQPGEGRIIKDRVVKAGGWVGHPGSDVFNTYKKPPTPKAVDGVTPARWIRHVNLLYPDEAEHVIFWMSHRVQRPDEKINHSLVLGGEPGIGKDTLIEPVKYAVGAGNFYEISPAEAVGRFCDFKASVIVRISEARDSGDIDRYKLYEHMKQFGAAPPDVLRVDEKGKPEHYVPNVTGAIYTTNYRTGGLYLPANDRRHFVAWSDLEENPFDDDYWEGVWAYFDNGGRETVAYYLATLDISAFRPKAPPRRTAAFYEMAYAGVSEESSDLQDTLDELGKPAVTPAMIREKAGEELRTLLDDGKFRRALPHWMDECGYRKVMKPGDTTNKGKWRVGGKRTTIYARKDLTPEGRLAAASMLSGQQPVKIRLEPL